MARYRRKYYRMRGRRFKRNHVNTAVGQIFGGLLLLLVFDSLLGAVYPSLCASTYFATTVTFIDAIIPVFGIIIVAVPIYNLFRKSVF